MLHIVVNVVVVVIVVFLLDAMKPAIGALMIYLSGLKMATTVP